MLRHKLKQDRQLLRRGAYPTPGEQLGAIVKILEVIMPTLPAEATAKIPPEALAVLKTVADVKAKFPAPPA